MNVLVKLLAASVLIAAQPVVADSTCTPLNRDVPVRSVLATAGLMANLRGSDNSIKSRMDGLLTDARSAAATLHAREEGCARSCADSKVAVVFLSKPNVELKGYDEAETCNNLLKATTAAPITYDKRRFPSDDAAKAWYNDLTQGNGQDGADLYKRCPGSCSPQYSSVAYRDGSDIVVSTSIICGPARDKDDNQYDLTAAVRWVCPM